MPTIGIDARTFFDAYSTARGIGQYALHHLAAVARLRPHWEFVLFGFSEQPVAGLDPLLRLPGTTYRRLDRFRPEAVDLVHIPDPLNNAEGFVSPMQIFRHARVTVSFYDLTPLHFHLRLMTADAKQDYLRRLDQLLKGNSVLLAISEYTRRDLVSSLRFPPERVHTVMAGLNRPALDLAGGAAAGIRHDEVRLLKEQLGIGKPFFLHVGALEQHKNFEAVLRSFALYLQRGSAQLVIVGKLIAQWQAQIQKVADAIGNVVTTGFISREHLELLYPEAIALLCLSRSEGFGLPVLEAMANRCPVIASNVSSIPEIAGDAALLFAPDDVDGVCRAMTELTVNRELRSRLIAAGLARAPLFTWEKTGEKTVSVWENMLDARGSVLAPSQAEALNVRLPERAEPTRPQPAAAGLPRSPNEAVAVKWGGAILYFNGMASHARKCLEALDLCGMPLAIDPFGMDKQFAEMAAPHELQRWRRLLNRRVETGVYICFALPTLFDGTDVFAHARDANPGYDAYVGVSVFETDRVPPSWVRACSSMDEVWVPSGFCRQTYARAGVEERKLHVFPTGLDTEILDPATVTPMEIEGRRGFVFLSVFQWTKRKGWDVLLKAYSSAFTAGDDVCLVLRTHPYLVKNPPIGERIDHYLKQLGHDPQRLPPIILLEDFIAESRMPSLYAAADAFVLPTRGEGFGLPLLEAMAMGLPVIATRWSGHLDFMNDDNSYLIDIDGLTGMDAEQMQESPFYTPDHRWAQPSVEHAAALMRRAYEQRDEAKRVGAGARQYVQRHCTYHRAADWMVKRVGELLDAKTAGGLTTSPKTAHAAAPQAMPDSIESPPLVWCTPLFHAGDAAAEARSLIGALCDRWAMRIEPQGRVSDAFAMGMEPAERERLIRLMNGKGDAPFIQLSLGPPDSFNRTARAIYHVGRIVSHTDRLPPEAAARCNHVDEVWVANEFTKDACERSGVKAPLYVIPGGVDTALFHPAAHPVYIAERRPFAFLSIFDWSMRKGWDLLLQAWAEAFAPRDEVCLILQLHGPEFMDHAGTAFELKGLVARFLLQRCQRSLQQVAPIIFLGPTLPPRDLPGVYTAADAFVLPARGEGLGRHCLQAMACGLPVIGTRWGGSLAFMTDENSYLIDIEGLVEVGRQVQGAGHGGQKWSVPSLDQLKDLMRHVFQDARSARAKGGKARQTAVERCGLERMAEAALARLLRVRSGLCDRPAH